MFQCFSSISQGSGGYLYADSGCPEGAGGGGKGCEGDATGRRRKTSSEPPGGGARKKSPPLSTGGGTLHDASSSEDDGTGVQNRITIFL